MSKENVAPVAVEAAAEVVGSGVDAVTQSLDWVNNNQGLIIEYGLSLIHI